MSIRESIDICGEETFLSLVKEETGVDIQEADAPQIQTIVSHIVPPIPRSTIVPAAVILAFKTFIPEARDIKNWDSDTVCNLIQGVHAQMKILQGELDDLKERLLANDEVQVIRPPAKRVRPSLNQTSSHVSRRGSRTLDLYNADSESEVEIIDSEGDADIDGNAEESLADILAKNETLESKLHLADTQLNMKIDENRNLKRLLLYNFQYGLQIGESLVCKYWKDIEGARKSKENSATIALRSIPVILGG
ncbi:hypothetical protein EAE96_008465 [Botrytis aclada]|nr:hypothetical protein EAE96_008465 [Botrytis aclada]